MLVSALSGPGPGPGDSAVRQALERQVAALSSLAARLERARLAYEPKAGEIGWRGSAQRAYASAVRRLRVDLDLAEHSVADALRDTRQSIEALGQRAF